MSWFEKLVWLLFKRRRMIIRFRAPTRVYFRVEWMHFDGDTWHGHLWGQDCFWSKEGLYLFGNRFFKGTVVSPYQKPERVC